MKYYFKIAIPLLITTIINYFLAYCVLEKISIKENMYFVYEALLLSQFGISKFLINEPTWYLSAFIICLPIFIYMLNKHRDFFLNIGSLFIPLLIYGYICSKYSTLDVWWQKENYIYIGVAINV